MPVTKTTKPAKEVEVKKPGFDAYSKLVKDVMSKLANELPILKHVKIISAKKVILSKKDMAAVIFVPLRMMRYFREQYAEIVAKMEKALGGLVFIIGKRYVAKTRKVGQKGTVEYKPRSRTAAAVKEAYLNEMLYPIEVVGKRAHVSMINKKPTEAKTVFVDVNDEKQKKVAKAKLNAYTVVYRNITGEKVKFAFPTSN